MKALSLSLVALTLCACATQTPYRPAERRGDYGYTETKLQENRYRVMFSGNSSTPAEDTKNYALLRAAELTLEKGYEWFQMTHRDTDKKEDHHTIVDSGIYSPPTTSVYRSCGLLSCNTTVVSEPGFSTGFGVGTSTASRAYTTEVEVFMGKKPKPASADSYDAREVVTNLRKMLQPRS